MKVFTSETVEIFDEKSHILRSIVEPKNTVLKQQRLYARNLRDLWGGFAERISDVKKVGDDVVNHKWKKLKNLPIGVLFQWWERKFEWHLKSVLVKISKAVMLLLRLSSFWKYKKINLEKKVGKFLGQEKKKN